jgi:hypothetical protein
MSAFRHASGITGEPHDSALCVRRLGLTCRSSGTRGAQVPFASANTKSDDEQTAACSSFEFNEKDGTLSIE